MLTGADASISARYFLHHYLLVACFCCVIAAFTNTIWPSSYWMQLGYSLSIGTCTWFFVEVGRILVGQPSDLGGWPQGIRGLAMVTVSIALGFFLGNWLSRVLLGITVGVPHDQQKSIIISVVAGIVAIYFFYTRAQNTQLLAEINAARRDAVLAQLKLLSAQLEPHMLFNTLANLRAMIFVDQNRAVTMLDHLDNYLRATLNSSTDLSHSLEDEFKLIGDYLALMQVRMGERLRYHLDLPDALRNMPVPPLILQPLVENCIKHGLEPVVGGGDIWVQVRCSDNVVEIQVRDNGAGLDNFKLQEPDSTNVEFNNDFDYDYEKGDPNHSRSFGLSLVRRRLANTYGEIAKLELSANQNHSGTVATVLIPMAMPALGLAHRSSGKNFS
jgi:hypothetical protein